MPRTARASVADTWYHVLNRGNRREVVYRTTGHVWQGRFKAFPVQDDDHLLGVLR